MTVRAYTSPQAFKQAIEQRLRTASLTGADFARRRQMLVFDRFLARIVAVFGNAALLKGGLVLELRLERARATKDVDLRLTGSPDTVLENLQEAGRRDLSDFMTFEINRDAEQPTIKSDGMRYEGLRFRAECRMRDGSTGSLLESTSHSAIRLSENLRSSLPRTYWRSLEFHRQLCGSIRWKPTSRKSCMRTRCLVRARTRE
ncbi:MAG: nucleotidyl transferase AbiEii/AbiGii toxin family protein [Steroidobacteraceae bacterium]